MNKAISVKRGSETIFPCLKRQEPFFFFLEMLLFMLFNHYVKIFFF